jgi:hypothetical protein
MISDRGRSLPDSSSSRVRKQWARENVTITCPACGRVITGAGDLDHTTIVSRALGEWPPRFAILDQCKVDHWQQAEGKDD